MRGAAARQVSDREAGERPIPIRQDALRRRDSEKPPELSPRIGDARRKADLVERIQSFDVREGEGTQGGGLFCLGVSFGLGDWGTGGLGEASHPPVISLSWRGRLLASGRDRESRRACRGASCP